MVASAHHSHEGGNPVKIITDNIDIWSSAIKKRKSAGRGSNKKIELYGIKKLRQLILELAVRGKLVPQDPNDEPASELLKKIAAEKTKLIKEGKIKKQKPLPPITDEEKPFELPEGWKWVKLGSLVEMYNGRAFKSSEWMLAGIPIVRIQNLNDINASFNFFDGELAEHHRINNGTFLISWSGTPGTSFGAFIWNRGEAALNQHINKCVFHSNEIHLQLFMRLAVNGCMNHFISMAQGGVGLKHVTKGTLNNAIIAFPPLEEQHRIVAKVDELMAFCDQLEQQQESSISAHQTLVETLLGTLTNSKTPEDFQESWTRIAEHFDTMFTTEHSIDQLKQTILELAITGRVVPFQDNSKEGVIKEFLSFGPRNGLSPKESPVETPYKVLKQGATSYGVLDLDQTKYVDIEIGKESHLWLKVGDVLVQRGNSHVFVGSNILIENDAYNVIYPDLMMKLRVTDEVIPSYLSLWLKSPFARNFMWERMTGTSGTMPKISKKVVENIPIIIPTKGIQEKVVTKVDELMTLCDSLKTRINDAQITQLHLADAMAEQAIL